MCLLIQKCFFLSKLAKNEGTLKGMFSDKLLPEHLYFVLMRFAVHPKGENHKNEFYVFEARHARFVTRNPRV